jgi:hypothetical protein
MMRTARWCGVALVLAAVALPASVSAQHLSWTSSAQADGDEVYVLFTEPTLLFGPDMGVRPFVKAGAYYVMVDVGDDSWGLTPAAGLRWQTDGGFIAGELGWALRDDGGVRVFGGDESGVHTMLQTEYYGDGSWGLSGIAAYNWGGDFLWSRARVLRRIATRSGGGGVSLGGELVWEAQTEDEDAIEDNEYDAMYVGPVLQIASGSTIWAISGGLKQSDPGDDDTWYARVEFTLP